MMRWVVLLVGGIAVLALIIALVGAMLPKAHTASREAQIPLPPDALYSLLTDIAQYQSWRGDVKSLQRLPDRDGRPAWIEDVGGMKIPMYFERMERPGLLVARIDGKNLAFGGSWTYRIASAPAGSHLTITEDGEVYNVIFRFMARFVFGYHATMDTFLENLQAKIVSR
jgi:hypothetical protein